MTDEFKSRFSNLMDQKNGKCRRKKSSLDILAFDVVVCTQIYLISLMIKIGISGVTAIIMKSTGKISDHNGPSIHSNYGLNSG